MLVLKRISCENEESTNLTSKRKSRATVKRRDRRNKLKSLRTKIQQLPDSNETNTKSTEVSIDNLILDKPPEIGNDKHIQVSNILEEYTKMSDNISRDDVLAARQAKKLAKQKGKDKNVSETKDIIDEKKAESEQVALNLKEVKEEVKVNIKTNSPKSKDEVDRAKVDPMAISDKSKEQIKAERAEKKAAKQIKKKGAGDKAVTVDKPINKENQDKQKPLNEDMTVKDVVETLREIVTVAKDIKDVTEKPLPETTGKAEESGKSKAELKAERRAKQEAQRALKQAAQEQKVAKPKEEVKATLDKDTASKDGKISEPKSTKKSKPKSQSSHRVNWFQHLYKDVDNESIKSIAINSHLHPAIIKLGVQLASRVVTGSNARCIALLDALKKMVRDYTLPAKTEFARGLESHLVASLGYLWASRPPSASQENAVKFFRYHLTQLPNNVDEFDAKKTLQEEIDRYIREQIDMAGEAISITVRNKISNGDNILTYGCSSLIERILREAWAAGVHFRTVVVGNRVHAAGTQMLRRLVSYGLPCTYVDITALSCVMNTINKVVLGAGALLGNGSVLGAVGSAQVAAAARACNVPVLVACETHKFCERVQTDAFVYNEIGDPDDLIDKSDENSPLKDWRSNQNLTPLNLTYDVTPASLVTAVVTELAILPCTSAPVVLRFKLSEYGV